MKLLIFFICFIGFYIQSMDIKTVSGSLSSSSASSDDDLARYNESFTADQQNKLTSSELVAKFTEAVVTDELALIKDLLSDERGLIDLGTAGIFLDDSSSSGSNPSSYQVTNDIVGKVLQLDPVMKSTWENDLELIIQKIPAEDIRRVLVKLCKANIELKLAERLNKQESLQSVRQKMLSIIFPRKTV